jgi:xanthosine utilization system XapX-like protein
LQKVGVLCSTELGLVVVKGASEDVTAVGLMGLMEGPQLVQTIRVAWGAAEEQAAAEQAVRDLKQLMAGAAVEQQWQVLLCHDHVSRRSDTDPSHESWSILLRRKRL